MLTIYPAIPFCPLVFPFPAYHQGKTTPKSGKNYILFGVLWCFLGKIGDRKGQKQRYILLLGVAGASVVALSLGRWCPLGAGGRGTLAILLTLAR